MEQNWFFLYVEKRGDFFQVQLVSIITNNKFSSLSNVDTIIKKILP